MKLSIAPQGEVEETSLQDCTLQLNGITAALESISSLEKIKKALLRSQGKKPTKQTIKIGHLALESIKKDTGIFLSGAVLSMECFTEETVSIEGFTDTIKSIVDAVVRTFKAVWEQIKRFIDAIVRGLGFEKQKRKMEDVKASVVEIKKLKEKKATKIPKEKKEALAHVDSALLPFRHLGVELTEDILTNELHLLQKTIKDCANLLLTLDVCNVNMADSAYTMHERGVSKETLHQANYAAGAFYRQMGTQFQTDHSIEAYSKVIEQKLGISMDIIDKSRVKSIPGLTRGNKVFVICKILKGNEDTDYQIVNVNEHEPRGKVTMKTSSLDHLLNYATSCQTTLDDYADVLATYANKNQSIQASQGKIVQSLSALIKKSSESHIPEASTNEDILHSTLRFMKAVTLSLTKATIDMQQIFGYIDKATEDHVKILIDLRKHYYEEVE